MNDPPAWIWMIVVASVLYGVFRSEECDCDDDDDDEEEARYDGLTCPWCRHECDEFDDEDDLDYASEHEMEAWDKDPFVDILICGNCGGTSLWRGEAGEIYLGTLSPPVPTMKPDAFYDVANASNGEPNPEKKL